MKLPQAAGIVCLLVAVLLLPTEVRAQLTFTTNNGSITITGYIGNPTNVNIPGTINGYPVTSIATNAFSSRLTLTSVTIPDSVTNIGNFAFGQCSGMTNFTVGGGLTTIGMGAFIQCLNLTSIAIPDSVTAIGYSAFYNCQSLTNVTFGSGLTSIGSLAFGYNYGLTSITIPNNVTNIGDYAFQKCTGLTNITIGSGVTSVGQYTLEGCARLASATIGIPTIGSSLFSSIISINGFTNLTSITMLDSVTNIGSYAFVNCQSLTNITIPQNVASIGIGAFSINALQAITVAPNNSFYSSVNGVLFDASQSTLIKCPRGLGTNSYTVLNSVTNIESGAFEFIFHLTKIYFMSNAPSYGASAFSFTFATVYYLPGTTGWGTTYGGLPTAPWLPAMQTNDGSFGMRTNQFGFNLNWASGQTVVVEACTNLSNPDWQPMQTNTLTTGSAYFSDSQWTNYPDRFYRLRSP